MVTVYAGIGEKMAIRRIVRDFDDLQVYQLASELADWVYDLTTNFPQDEKYNVTSQIKKAVTSVGANIAEGYGRFHYKENIQFCRQARGSLAETKHFMLFGKKRDYVNKEILEKFLTEYTKLQVKLNNYINSIGKNINVSNNL